VREHSEHFRAAEKLGIGSRDAWHLWAHAHNTQRRQALREHAPEVPEEWCVFDEPPTTPERDEGIVER
jgi:hypothetical protein